MTISNNSLHLSLHLCHPSLLPGTSFGVSLPRALVVVDRWLEASPSVHSLLKEEEEPPPESRAFRAAWGIERGQQMADGCGILQLNLRNHLLQLSMKRIMKSMRIPRRKPGDATGLKEGYQTRNPNFFPAFAHAEITPPFPKKKLNSESCRYGCWIGRIREQGSLMSLRLCRPDLELPMMKFLAFSSSTFSMSTHQTQSSFCKLYSNSMNDYMSRNQFVIDK